MSIIQPTHIFLPSQKLLTGMPVEFCGYSFLRRMRLFQIVLATTLVFMFGCNARHDELDAERAAERIHSQIKSQDSKSIYSESDDSFKEAGDESKFVAAMQKIYAAYGPMKTATPISYQSVFDSNIGAKQVLTFELEFERARAKEKITFTRSRNGQMQLWDIVIDPIE